MAVPVTDQEGRRWHDVYNPLDVAIPAFGTVWCGGKRFDGDYDERRLPKDSNEQFPKSWTDLQKKVGFGNLLLIAQRPYDGWGWSYYTHGGFYHNGPTAIPSRSWGRVTRDYPTIARVKIIDRPNSTRSTKLGYATFSFTPRKKSFDLTARLSKYGYADSGWGWGWGFGWGWGWSARYGQPAMYNIVDIVSGFNSSEGLAWIAPGESSGGNSAYEIYTRKADSVLSTVDDGENTFAFDLAYATGLGYVTAGPVFAKDGKLQIAQPGVYTLDLSVKLTGTGAQAPDDENPWSQIMFALETKLTNDGGGDSRVSFQPAVTLAPPVVKQGFYGAPSTYLTHYESCRLLYNLIVTEPENYDPQADDLPVLATYQLRVTRSTNAPSEMNVIVEGQGTLNSMGQTTEAAGQDSKSLLIPG